MPDGLLLFENRKHPSPPLVETGKQKTQKVEKNMKTLKLFVLACCLAFCCQTVSAARVVVVVPSGHESDAIINAPNQYIGEIDLYTLRPITIDKLKFSVTSANLINNICLVDCNGAIVAGPVDAVPMGAYSSFQFSDPVQVPKGKSSYTLVGRLSTGFTNGETFTVCPIPTDDLRHHRKSFRRDEVEVVVLPRHRCGSQITACSGVLNISTDSSSPAFSVVAGGSVGVVVGTYKLRAIAEPVRLYSLGLKLETNPGPGDIIQATIWDSTGQVGNAIFVGNQHWAVSVFSQPVYIPADAEKVLMIRVDLALIGVAQSGKSGDVVKVDYDDTRPENTLAGGVITGQEVPVTGTTDVAGVRMFKSYPTFALDPLPSTGIAGDGRLLLFKVTASPAGPVTINKMSFRIGGVGTFNDWASLVVYSDSTYSHIVKSYGGLVGRGLINLTNQPVALMYPRVVIPAGSTYYFELLGDCSGVAVTTLLGNDSSGSSTCFDNNDYMMWSPNTTTMSQPWDCDWWNGYGLPGLPSSGITQTRTQ